jgi:hypothetical protein
MGKLPVEPRLVSFSMREGCGVLARYSVAMVTEAEPSDSGGISTMTVANYRIYEIDPANHVTDDYSVVCRSDTAALAMASNGADNRAAAVDVWEGDRHVVRLDPVTPWNRLRRQWTSS